MSVKKKVYTCINGKLYSGTVETPVWFMIEGESKVIPVQSENVFDTPEEALKKLEEIKKEEEKCHTLIY